MYHKKIEISWKSFCLLVIMLLLITSNFFVPSNVQAKERKTIRVGWPNQDGLTEKKGRRDF